MENQLINRIADQSRMERNAKNRAKFFQNWKNRFGWMLKLA